MVIILQILYFWIEFVVVVLFESVCSPCRFCLNSLLQDWYVKSMFVLHCLLALFATKLFHKCFFFLFQPQIIDLCVTMTARLKIENFMGGLPSQTLIQTSVHTWSMLSLTLVKNMSWSPPVRLTDSNTGPLIA